MTFDVKDWLTIDAALRNLRAQAQAPTTDFVLVSVADLRLLLVAFTDAREMIDCLDL